MAQLWVVLLCLALALGVVGTALGGAALGQSGGAPVTIFTQTEPVSNSTTPSRVFPEVLLASRPTLLPGDGGSAIFVWDQVVSHTNGTNVSLNSSTGRITFLKAGIYALNANVFANYAPTGQSTLFSALFVTSDSGNYGRDYHITDDTDETEVALSVAATVSFSAGATLDFRIDWNGADNVIFLGQSSGYKPWLSVTEVSLAP
jgi:hypothetical protein